MKLECLHADTCLSDFWSGHSLAHLQVPVQRGMTGAELRDALKSEISQGAWAGSDERTSDNHPESDAFDTAARQAVDDLVILKEPLFMDLEMVDDEDCTPDVYAFFVFRDVD
jgi:hypothetical protein